MKHKIKLLPEKNTQFPTIKLKPMKMKLYQYNNNINNDYGNEVVKTSIPKMCY